jgi:hypothetical protein
MSKGVVLESYSIKENQRKRRGKTKKIIIKKRKSNQIKENQRKRRPKTSGRTQKKQKTTRDDPRPTGSQMNQGV